MEGERNGENVEDTSQVAAQVARLGSYCYYQYLTNGFAQWYYSSFEKMDQSFNSRRTKVGGGISSTPGT